MTESKRVITKRDSTQSWNYTYHLFVFLSRLKIKCCMGMFETEKTYSAAHINDQHRFIVRMRELHFTFSHIETAKDKDE